MKKRRLLNLFTFVSAILFISGVSFTYAAYINSQKFNQNYTVDLSYTNFFGTGSSYQNYKISEPEHLRNLARLTNMGCFTEKDVFTITLPEGENVLTWDDPLKPMLPIGTMHNPFRSTFEGAGATIQNLQVKAFDTADIGMFGYASKSAKIQNFILKNPVITSDSKGTFTYNSASNNIDNHPFRKENLLDRKYCRQVNVVPVAKTQNQTNGKDPYSQTMTSFNIVLPKLNILSHLNNPSYEIRCSHPDITINDVTQASGNPTFKCEIAKDLTTTKNVTIEIYIIALMNLGTQSNSDYRFGSFNMETLNFNYDNSTKGFYCNTSNPKCYRKLIYPDLVFDKQNNNVNYYINNQHIINVGIVIGTLNGYADHILVYDGKIDVKGRPFNSNSILIGKYIEDSNKGNVLREVCNVKSIEDLNFNDIYKSENDLYTSSSQKNFKVGNRYLKGIYNTVDNDSTQASSGYNPNKFSRKIEKGIKIYGTNNAPKNKNDIYPETGHTKRTDNVDKSLITLPPKDGVVYKKMKVDGVDALRPCISFQDDIETSMYLTTRRLEGFHNVSASNAIEIWPNPAATDKNLWDRFTTSVGNNNLVINITFDYLFFDWSNNYNNAGDSMVYLEPNVTKKTENETSGLFMDHGRFLGNRFNRSNEPTRAEDFGEGSVRSERGMRYIPTLPGENGLHNQNYTHKMFWTLDWVDSTGLQTYDTNFGPADLTVAPDANDRMPLNFYSDETYKEKPDSTKQYKTKQKTISLKFTNKFFSKNIFQSGERTPIIYLGLRSPNQVVTLADGTQKALNYVGPYDANGNFNKEHEQPRIPQLNYEFDIFNLDVTMSDKAGNLNAKIASVDIGNTGGTSPTFSKNQWSNWPSHSMSKPEIEGFKTVYADVTNDNVKIEPVANYPTRYVITITRGKSSTDKPILSYAFNSTSTDANLIPHDSKGFMNYTTYKKDNTLIQ